MRRFRQRNRATGSSAVASPAFTVLFEPLTNSTGTVTTLAYINGAASGSTITLSVDDSRASGVAPLSVFFDATGTTSTQTTRPQHDIGYYWDFGDTGAGTWTYGTGANTSKNLAYGPVAQHVFETAGTYTVEVTAHDGVSTTSTTKTITVTAANTQWATTKTICLANGAAPVPGVNGVPTGATCVGSITDFDATIASYIGSGDVRILFKAGDSFTASTAAAINQPGPAMIGSFGTGAKPVITATSTASVFNLNSGATSVGRHDWRFQDIDIDGDLLAAAAFSAAGTCSQILLNRVDMRNVGYGFLLSGSTLDSLNTAVPFTHAMWDQISLNDCTVDNMIVSSGPCGIFASATRMAVQGCSFDNNGGGEHGIRMQYCNRGVFSHNTVQGIPTGKLNLTLRGTEFGGSNSVAAGAYTEKIVVSDNHLIGGVSTLMMSIQPQNPAYDERGRNYIVERNYFDGSTSTGNFMTVAQTDVTIRNNVGRTQGDVGGSFVTFQSENANPAGIPNRGHVYNNSFYHAATGSYYFALMFVGVNEGDDLAGCTFECKNNILYAPSASSVDMAALGTYPTNCLATLTEANNSDTVSAIATTPAFATNPPTALAHFTPSGASYAAAAGTSVKNWRDMYGTTTDATPDLGAVRIA